MRCYIKKTFLWKAQVKSHWNDLHGDWTYPWKSERVWYNLYVSRGRSFCIYTTNVILHPPACLCNMQAISHSLEFHSTCSICDIIAFWYRLVVSLFRWGGGLFLVYILTAQLLRLKIKAFWIWIWIRIWIGCHENAELADLCWTLSNVLLCGHLLFLQSSQIDWLTDWLIDWLIE